MNPEIAELLKQILPPIRAKMEEIAEEEEFCFDLCGLCARAAATVHNLLKMFGLNPKLCIGGGHVFSAISDYVIDVTATQFGGPSIFISHLNDLEGYAFLNRSAYKILFSSENIESVIAELAAKGWSPSQRPVIHEYSEIPAQIFEEFKHLRLAEVV